MRVGIGDRADDGGAAPAWPQVAVVRGQRLHPNARVGVGEPGGDGVLGLGPVPGRGHDRLAAHAPVLVLHPCARGLGAELVAVGERGHRQPPDARGGQFVAGVGVGDPVGRSAQGGELGGDGRKLGSERTRWPAGHRAAAPREGLDAACQPHASHEPRIIADGWEAVRGGHKRGIGLVALGGGAQRQATDAGREAAQRPAGPLRGRCAPRGRR